MKCGVVQGRLLPQVGDFIQNHPSNNWLDEFQIASRVGCSHIEWTITRNCITLSNFGLKIDREANKFATLTHEDVAYIREAFNVDISAVCLDFFLAADFQELSINEMVSSLLKVAQVAVNIDVDMIVIPLLERASVRLPSRRARMIKVLQQTIQALHDRANDNYFDQPVSHLKRLSSMKFSLETDMNAVEIEKFLSDVGYCDNIGITFDTGNLLRLGYDLIGHVATYGSRIDNIHVKDAIMGHGSVPLGSGKLGKGVLGKILRDTGASRVTLQTSRLPPWPDETSIMPVDLYHYNVSWIRDALNNNNIEDH